MFTSTCQSRNQQSFLAYFFLTSVCHLLVEPGAAKSGAIESGAVEPGAVQPGAVEPGFGESLCPALHLSLGFISRHPATQWSLSANRSKGRSGLTLPLKSGLLMILFPFCFEDLLISSQFFFFFSDQLAFSRCFAFCSFLKACVGESSGFLTHTLVFAGFHALPVL